MRRETAAAYCDMSPGQFDAQCPVPAKDQGWRGLRWDRAALDRWIDNLPDRPAKELDGVAPGAAVDEPAPPPTAAERRRASLERALR